MKNTNEIIQSLAACAGPGCQWCSHYLDAPDVSCIKQLTAEAHAALAAA